MADLGIWTIPGYVVHERLDTGVVTATWLASRTADGYPVIAHVVNEPYRGTQAALRFRAAAEQVAVIRHPVIPTVREIGEIGGVPFVITAAIEGRSLGATLATRRTLTIDDTLAVCTELADALDVLAEAGVAHGAVSPASVWMNDRERAPSAPYVCLRGFGTAPLEAMRMHDGPGRPPPAELLYTAPEQLHGPPTHRSDQYALACLTLHCLTGALPFARPTVGELLDAHVEGIGEEVPDGAERLPPRVLAALRRGLATDPADRFDSATTFATAIGGTSRRSWTWTLEHGTPAGTTTREIDIRDGVAAAAVDAHPAHGRPDESVGMAPARSPASRALADLDWLPGSATRTGPQRPVRVPRATAGPRPRRLAATPISRVPPRWWRRMALIVLTAAVMVPTIAFTRAVLSADRSAPTADLAALPTSDGVHEIDATWHRVIADAPVTVLYADEAQLISASGGIVASHDPSVAVGDPSWVTDVDDPVLELAVVGRTVIVRTAAELVGIGPDGGVRWRSSGTGPPEIDAVATGRGRLFAIGTDADGRRVIHAIDPATGARRWSTAIGPADLVATGQPALIALGGGQQPPSVYVAAGGRLHAYNVETRRRRWHVALHDPRPVSLTAVADAVLVVGRGGKVCRHHADDGHLAWTECPTVSAADGPAVHTQVRDSRVIVAGARGVSSIHFTSGTPQWEITTHTPLQPVLASNRVASFVAAGDGTVEAIGQRTGASLWESAPFGELTTLAATDDAVFLTTPDGQLWRLEAPTAAAVRS